MHFILNENQRWNEMAAVLKDTYDPIP